MRKKLKFGAAADLLFCHGPILLGLFRNALGTSIASLGFADSFNVNVKDT